MKIGFDKIEHCVICAVVAFFTSTLMWQLVNQSYVAVSALMGVTMALFGGAVKEYADKAHGGKWDWCDFLADTIGAVVGIVGFLVIVFAKG